jgi:periplasmic copper chaperone A
MSSVRSIGLVVGVVGAVVALAACGSDGASSTSGDVAVEEAWVREPAAGQTSVAAYATIVNGTDHAVTLRDATSALTDDVSVHETMIAADGTMSMGDPDGGLTIEPGASFVLEPGGAHVMLDGVEAGDVEAPVEVTFVFDDGSEAGLDVTVEADVRPLDASGDTPESVPGERPGY